MKTEQQLRIEYLESKYKELKEIQEELDLLNKRLDKVNRLIVECPYESSK